MDWKVASPGGTEWTMTVMKGIIAWWEGEGEEVIK